MQVTITTTFDPASALSARARAMTASTIREILKVTAQPDVISFAGGLPAPELFPVEAVRAATNAVLDRYGPAALQYSTTEGHLPLREWIAAQEAIAAANVQIVTGSQQGLDLLGKVLIDPGDVVLVESPTYLGALQAFSAYSPQYRQVPTDADGIDVNALAEVLAHTRAKLLYTVPNFQNPTGRTMSGERRAALVELTARHGVMVVEDDPYGQLRFRGEAQPSLFSLGVQAYGVQGNHIIRCSSFSKTLVPGLREGWVQASTAIIGKLVMAKQGADLHTPTLDQLIVTELLDDVLPHQVSTVRRVYGERAAHMVATLDRLFGSTITRTDPEGGMFCWVALPEGLDSAQLLPAAVERKVAFVPGSPFFAHGGGENCVRLSFSCATFDELDRGLAALAEVVYAAL